jgi:hypothetical protein
VEVCAKEFANVAEESSAVGDVAKGNFILLKVTRLGAFLITQLK